jgi:DNA-binding transcriptional LysR family regulator
MDVRALRCFLAIAEELHFGRAAARLHMSQPPLSQQVRRLETSLGVRLFDRNKRSVKLTSAGAMLVRDARLILAQIERTTQAVKCAEFSHKEHVRVGFVSAAMVAGLGNVFQVLRTKELDVVDTWIEIGSAEQIEALRSERIDIGFAHTPLDYGGMKAFPLIYQPFMVALPSTHKAAARQQIRLSDLAGEAFLVGPRDGSPGYYDQVHAVCNEAGYSPQVVQQARHLFSALNLVSMGLGIALVPSSFKKIVMPGVTLRNIEGSNRAVELSVLWNPKNKSPTITRIVAALRNSAGGAIEGGHHSLPHVSARGSEEDASFTPSAHR